MNSPDELRRENEALRDRISRLSAAVLRISASLDLDTVLHEIVESSRALTGARYGGITTLDESGQARDFVTSGITPEEHQQLAVWSDGPRLFEHLRDLPGALRVRDLPDYVRSLGLSSDLLPPSKTLQGTPMRLDFRGFEVNVAHDYFDGGGDTNVAGIWGGRIGSSSAVFSAERVGRQELRMEERPWTLDRLSEFVPGSRAGWSLMGNPGVFSVGAPAPWTAEVFDPRCTDFGGQDEGWTCRFRYAPYDNLIEAQQQTRAFAELNGPLNDRTGYHVEALWADAVIPNWYTTPSYGPVPPPSTTIMEVAAGHPGRQAFCGGYAGDAKADPTGACLTDAPWYFHGRPFGNSGPARRVRRDSRTQRIAASVDGDLGVGGRDAHWDVGVSYSRARGNFNLPGIYRDRIFRAFRGFGGPDCGVGVTAAPTAPAGMVLGPLAGAVAGQGPCMYYNPFSNAIEYADQPGARFRSTPNPDYVPALANPEALRRWLNEEVELASTTDLLVADATLSRNLVENVADFAVGYQYRGMRADGDPNDPGDATLNPCAVAGDLGCALGDQFGPYFFTGVHRPYAADQQVQRLFGELALGIGPRVDTQIAANYEFYNVAGR